MKMRRIAPAVALAGALALAPTVAWADNYPPPEVVTSLPGTVAEPGESFTLTIPAEAGDEVTLTITNPNVPSSAIQIAGTASKTKTAVDNSGVTFTVTLTQPGAFSLTGKVNGEVVFSQQLSVETPSTGGAGTGNDGDQPVYAATGGQAEVTGSEALLYGVGAVLLVGAGTAVVVGARKRRNAAA